MNSAPFLIRLVAATLIARQNKLLMAELVVATTDRDYYRELVPLGTVLHFTNAWRLRYARAGAAVAALAGWKRVGDLVSAAKAKTIQGWERLRKAGKLGVQRAGRGRPRIEAAIEQVIRRLAQENPVWGQKRIAGVLAMCLLAVSPRAIAAVLKRGGLKPAPQRTTDWSWRRFVTEKADAICATDFFTVDQWELCWHGLVKRSYDVLFAIHHATRQVEILGVTEHSNEAYMVQTARNATMADVGWFKRMGCHYLIHDGDKKFCPVWQETLRQAGITTKKIPPHSPNCNAVAERWVSSVKREMIRRCWFLDYGGLCKALSDFATHYNSERPHQSMGNRPPTGNPGPHAATQKIVAGFKPSQIRCVTRCNGTIRHYYRVAA